MMKGASDLAAVTVQVAAVAALEAQCDQALTEQGYSGFDEFFALQTPMNHIFEGVMAGQPCFQDSRSLA